MKIIAYPETRQVFSFDCGANALVSVLVFAGLEEREDRVALLAGTSRRPAPAPPASCVSCNTTGCGTVPASECRSTICGGPSTPAILRC